MNRKGFTLIEIMLVVVIAGALMVLGFPRIRDSLIRSDVRGASQRIATLYAQARANAIQTGRTTTIWRQDNRVWVVYRDAAGVLDTLGTVYRLDSLYGVTVTSNSNPDRIQIDARGIIIQMDEPYLPFTVTRDTYSRTIKIGKFGSIVP